MSKIKTKHIDDDAITYAKMQNVSATDKVLGRASAGAGDVEEIACTGTGDVAKATSPTFVTQITTPIINLTGGQIAFPASQAASANVNTLDDYEEGTFTPTITFGGGSTGITYGWRVGSYTKIGNRVTITGHIYMTNIGTSTGAAKITALPFTCDNNRAATPAVAFQNTGITFADFLQGHIEPNTSEISLGEVTNAGATTSLTNADFKAGIELRFYTTYRVT